MKTTLSALHHQGNDWNRDLDFYIDELTILTKRLDKTYTKKADPKAATQAGRFLKKFVALREKTEALKAAVNAREKKIESIITSHPDEIFAKLKPVNDTLFERHKKLAETIAATRFEFNQFLVKNL